MFLRTKTTPTGTVLQLVEAYRDPEGMPRQRIRASLGEASLPESLWRIVACGVESRLTGQSDMILDSAPAEVLTWVDRIVRCVDVRAMSQRKNPAALPPAPPSAAEPSLPLVVESSPDTHAELPTAVASSLVPTPPTVGEVQAESVGATVGEALPIGRDGNTGSDTIVKAASTETAIVVPSTEEPVSPSTDGGAEPRPAPLVVDGVIIDEITHQNTTLLGPLLVAMQAWKALEMPRQLGDLGLNTTQIQGITAEVINRLVEPVSEHALCDWVNSTALIELLGDSRLPTDHHGYYRACDVALRHRAAISAHLRQREREHFRLQRTILLYDLTNTYFEGQMLGNKQAKRGHSKEKRNDCPLLVVGMVFDEHGFELGHEVFEGNKNDGKSLVDMVQHLQSAVDPEPTIATLRPLVIVDGGIATDANRILFQEKGFDFLANDSRRGRIAYAQYFEEPQNFVAIPDREGNAEVLVRQLPDPKAKNPATADTLILCKSSGRRQKELAIISAAEKRFLADIERLRSTIAKGKRCTRVVIEADLARICARHPRVMRYYVVNLVEKVTPTTTTTAMTPGESLKQEPPVVPDTPATKKTPKRSGRQASMNTTAKQKLVVECARKQDAFDEAHNLLGCYVLRTCSTRLSDPKDWWQLYMTLSHAEDGFRALKSDLGLRPIRHQREDRGESHVFISVLAYHLLHFILFSLKRAGDHRAWSTIRRVLSTHCYTTVVVPTTAGVTHRLRIPGSPDLEQQRIYQTLGINWKSLPRISTVVS